MDSTTQDWNNFFAEEKQKEADPNFIETLNRQIQDKIQRELALIERSSSACPYYRSDDVEFNEEDFRKNIGGLDFGKVKELASKQFFNKEVMIGVSCATDSMFYSISNKQGSSSVCEVVREEIDKLKVMASGVQGQGGSAEMGHVKDLFWYKIPRPGAEDDLMHELFIGLMGTNLLREECYNFSFIYGGFRTRKPVVDLDGNVTTLCPAPGDQINTATSVPFLMMENLAGSTTLKQNFSKMGVSEILSTYIQILLALNIANKKIGFTHYDLHGENVLLRDISDSGFGREFLIPYPFAKNRLYVMATKVATIIDYGMSGINYQGTYYGNTGLYDHRYAAFNDKPWPLHDAYKLLMFMIQYSILQNRPEAEAALTKIFRFFNKKEDPRNITTKTYVDNFGKTVRNELGLQWDSRFALPYNENTSKHTILELVYFILKEFPRIGIVFTQPPKGYNILECTSCLSFNQVARIVGAAEPIPKPKTFFHLYDAAMLESRLGQDKFNQIIKSFDYPTAKDEFMRKVKNLLTDITTMSSVVTHIDLQPGNVFDPVSVLNVRRNNELIYKMIDTLERLNFNINIGQWVGQIFNDDNLINSLTQYSTDIVKYRPMICELVTRASQNYTTIYNAMMTPAWNSTYSKDQRFVWYAESAGDIISLQNRACVSPVITQPIKINATLPLSPRSFVPESFDIPITEMVDRANSPRSEFFRQRPDQMIINPGPSSSNIFGL